LASVRRIVVPTPFPVGPVNCYLVLGEPLGLVDTGPRTPEARAALEAGLRDAGVALEDLEVVVLTHAHVDHVGLAGLVAGASRAKLVIHPVGVPWLRNYAAAWDARSGSMFRFARAMGVPEARCQEQAMGMRRLGGFGPEPLPGAGIEPIDEGDRVALGGRTWRVLHLPGHSPTDLALWDPEAGEVLAGDILLQNVSSNALVEPVVPDGRAGAGAGGGRGVPGAWLSLRTYLASLTRLRELPARVILAGHGPAVREHRALIDERLAFHRDRLEEVHRRLDGPRTAYQVSRDLFGELGPGQLFLGLSEVVGHLSLLVEEGRVAMDGTGGVIRFRRARARGKGSDDKGFQGDGFPSKGKEASQER